MIDDDGATRQLVAKGLSDLSRARVSGNTALIGLLSAIGAYILVHASNEYGIPVREYWR
jgi:hypothetical protein